MGAHTNPIWELKLSLSEDDPNQAPKTDPATDRGFPEGTPVAEMTDAQKAAYFRHQNRQADNKLAKFNGVTPEDVAAMQAKIQELESEKLSADERTLHDATNKAASDAQAAAEATWRPKYQAAQLKSIAAQVLTDSEKLKSFMSITDPALFAGEDGEIDESKVTGHLTALLGQGGKPPEPPQWGQTSGYVPGQSAKDAGIAEARRRGYIKDKESE